MAMPAERLTSLVGDIQTYLPDAIDGEVDVSHHLRMSGGMRGILTATVEPPMVEVRFVTTSQPNENRFRVLRAWAMTMTHPQSEDPLAAPGVRLQSTQVYAATVAEAAGRGWVGTEQRVVSDYTHFPESDPCFVEAVVAGVIAEQNTEAHCAAA
jgi:hypothetical protein